jgi:hypothetical protein
MIASNRANPVHDGVAEPTASCNVVIDVDKPVTTNGVTPERRISPSQDLHHPTANGVIVKSSSGQGFESVTTEATTTTEDDNVTTALLRRHSLPNRNVSESTHQVTAA